MSSIYPFRTQGQQYATPATLGEIVLTSYELQARARGAWTVRILLAVGRTGIRLFRGRSMHKQKL